MGWKAADAKKIPQISCKISNAFGLFPNCKSQASALTLGVRCGQEKRPVLAAEKKSLGEIAKELSAMWGVDAKEN